MWKCFIVFIILCIHNCWSIYTREELSTRPPYTRKVWRTIALPSEPNHSQITVHHNYSRVRIHGQNQQIGELPTHSSEFASQVADNAHAQLTLDSNVEPVWTKPESIQQVYTGQYTGVNDKLNWGQIQEKQSGIKEQHRTPKGHYIIRESSNTNQQKVDSGEIKIHDKLMRLSTNPTYKLEIRPKQSTYIVNTKSYSNMAFENCPKNATGPVAYLWSCSQFLNCWKGRGIVQNCAAGTHFNPESLECDWPHKVNCISGPHDQKVKFEKYSSPDITKICTPSFSGLLPHPTDCSKFINCVSGQTYIQDCGPGTAFNSVIQACDHPHKVGCNINEQKGDYTLDESEIRGYINSNLNHGFEPGNIDDYNQQIDQNYDGSHVIRVYDQNILKQHKDLNIHGQNCPGINCGRPQPQNICQQNGQNCPNNNCKPTETFYQQGFLNCPNNNCGGIQQSNGQNLGQIQAAKQEVKCPQGHSGLLPHPYICEKFLNCANGATFVQDCGPGTVFNPDSKVCDWPYNVKCTTRKPENTGHNSGQYYGQHGQNTAQYSGQTTHRITTSYGQNTGQYSGQVSGQNRGQYYGQTTRQHGQNTGQYYGQTTQTHGQNYGHNTRQYGSPCGPQSGPNCGQNTGQYSGQSTQTIQRNITTSGQNTGQYGSPCGPNSGPNCGQNTGHYHPQNTGQNYGQNTRQYGSPCGPNSGPNCGHNTGQYPGQTIQRNTTTYGHNTGQYYGQNTGQYGSPCGPHSGPNCGQNTGQYPGQNNRQYSHSVQNTGQYPSQTIQRNTTTYGQNTGHYYGQNIGQYGNPCGPHSGPNCDQNTGQSAGLNNGQYSHTIQRNTTTYGQNTGQYYGQNAGQHGSPCGPNSEPNCDQNTAQYPGQNNRQYSHSVQNTGQYPSQTIQRNITTYGQNTGQRGSPCGPHSGPNCGQNTAQYPGQHTGQYSGYNTGQYGSSCGPNSGPNCGQNTGQYPGHTIQKTTTTYGQNTGQYGSPCGPNSGPNCGQNTGQNNGQYSHSIQNTRQYPSQTIQRNTTTYGQNTGQYSGHDTGQYGSSCGPNSGPNCGQNTGQYPGQNSGQYNQNYQNSKPVLNTSDFGQNCGQKTEFDQEYSSTNVVETTKPNYTRIIGYRRDPPNFASQSISQNKNLEIVEPADPIILNSTISVYDNTKKTGKHWPPPFPSTDTSADYYFEEVTETSEHKTGKKVWKNAKSCTESEFECSFNECIPEIWHCDGEMDCRNGVDEKNCNFHLKKFTTIPNSRLYKHEVEKWLNTDLDTCANNCLKSKSFTCKSFNYKKHDKVCMLCDTNVGLSGALAKSHLYDYFELSVYSVNCSNKYKCSTGKCINHTQICDGNDDCGNRQDEKDCSAQSIGYQIKLAGSPNKHEGRIEIKVFNEWGFICDDQFSLRNADVVCRELGFNLGALEVKSGSYFARNIKDNETYYLMDDVQCLGNETSIRNCDFSGWGVHNCMPQEVVGVVCKTPLETCPEDQWKCDTTKECLPLQFLCDGIADCADRSDEGIQHCQAPIEVRLKNGSAPNEGRVEIRYHGVWGSVCDDDFTDITARVVCRSLGFHGTAAAKKDGAFGPGKGPIWLDQVNCVGNENSIDECAHWNWGEHNCEHSEDAGVVCSHLDTSEFEKKSKDDNIFHISPVTPNLDETLFIGKCGFRADDIFNGENTDNSDVHFRVVKGTVAKKGDYPWQATIRVKGKEKSSHWCGAVVISNKFVLTAAHCLVGFSKGAYIIRAGDYTTSELEGTEVESLIEDFFIHERFRQGGHMNNDIAVVKLKGSGLRLSNHVQPICLPTKDQVYKPGSNCTISGFGSTQTGKSTSSNLLRAGWVSLQPQDICRMPQVYGDSITDGMLCAGSLDEGVDSCDGDSGGPLACLNQGLFTLYGITSWGQRCGHINKPGVYVNVAHYRDWIDKTIENNSN